MAWPMTVVYAVSPRDVDLALRALGWSVELGWQDVPLRLMLSRSLVEADREQLIELGIKGFAEVKVTEVPELVPLSGWPVGPNLSFFLAAEEMSRGQSVSWLFLEPDAVPVKAGWAERLAEEYGRRGGKGVLGVAMPDCIWGTYTAHVSGVAVYPKGLWAEAGRYLTNLDKPFDLALAPWALPLVVGTRLIHQRWKPGGNCVDFRGKEDLKIVSPEAVIFHRDKAGVLITLLRSELPRVDGAGSKTVSKPGRKKRELITG